jgi:dihydrofolate synthase/folylpolyglutamate synthase
MAEIRTFAAALAFAGTLIDRGMKLGLENTRRLLAAVGDPQRELRFIHVAGTNGKGSVCALLTAALQAHGWRVGLFTSPHLVSPRERIRIGGQSISEADFTALTAELRERARDHFEGAEPMRPTYFEFMTALSLLYYARQRVDYVVFEVGMGGRLDSTNVITPLLSVITNIDFDHMQYLGHTLTAIAGEKAGIIKPGVPVVIGERKPEPLARLLAEAETQRAPVCRLGADFEAVDCRLEATADGAWRQLNHLRWQGRELELPTRLIGRYQLPNVAVAYAALQVLRQAGLPLREETLRAGLADAQWPARMQRLPDGLLIDSAHNPAGMAETVASLQTLCPGRRFHVLLGMLSDKAWQESVALLVPIAASLRVCRIGQPRSESPWVIKRYVRQHWPELPVQVVRSVPSGLRQLRRAGDGLIVGSIYFAGEIFDTYQPGQPVDW